MFCVSFSGRLKGKGPSRSDRRWVPTVRGVSVEVENVIVDGEEGEEGEDDRVVVCNVHVPASYGVGGVLVPCFWNCLNHTQVTDLYALPTWLQLVSKPHEFALPETEHPWDLIPVMVTICMRMAMTSIMQFGALIDHMAMALLADGFDCKYGRYTKTIPMAIDALLLQMTQLGPADTSTLAYCGMVGGYLIAHFFDSEVYAPSDLWQSAVNNAYDRPSGLMFHSNMSDVRCKIMGWMCGVEDELRAASAHASTIVGHASCLLEHTIHVFNHYDTVEMSFSEREAPRGDGCGGCDGDNALPSASTVVRSELVVLVD